jgi:hypothetical protein
MSTQPRFLCASAKTGLALNANNDVAHKALSRTRDMSFSIYVGAVIIINQVGTSVVDAAEKSTGKVAFSCLIRH